MICPYNRKKEIQVSQSGFSYNDDNLNDVSGGTVVVTFEPMECRKRVARSGTAGDAITTANNEQILVLCQ